MGDVVLGRKFVLDPVRTPVGASPGIQKTAVGHTGEPLDFSAGVDILLVGDELVGVHEQGTDGAFDQLYYFLWLVIVFLL